MRKILCLIIFCFVLQSLPANAFPPKEKWISLFNGKDLAGWKLVNGKAKYEVVDGMIVGTCVKDSPNSFLAVDKEYGDFILEVELLAHPLMNSGVI